MGIIGGIASAIIGSKSAKKASQQASQGFDYIRSNPLVQQVQERGGVASDRIGALLGLGGDTGAAQQAFDAYRGSTGYNFRMGQGISAIEQSAASRGLLSSGATAKGLTEFGQGLASSEFQNYLSALGGAESTGLNAVSNVANAGAQAGAQAAEYTRQGAGDIMGGLGSALQGVSAFRSAPTSSRGSIFGY